MPRKSQFPIWVDEGGDELSMCIAIESPGFLDITINDEELFSLNRADAKDLARELLKWADAPVRVDDNRDVVGTKDS